MEFVTLSEYNGSGRSGVCGSKKACFKEQAFWFLSRKKEARRPLKVWCVQQLMEVEPPVTINISNTRRSTRPIMATCSSM